VHSSYNRIAGRSVERLEALSDGIFGVGMTLLVLDLRLPAIEVIHSEQALLTSLETILPQLVMYMMSFLTLGIFWVGQQTQLNHLQQSDRHLTWITLAFLFAVTLMPFSTKMLAEFPAYRAALLGYWFNIFLLGLGMYCMWGYAARHRMFKPDTPADVPAVVCRRIIGAQSLYAGGAALCVLDTRLSIAAIVLVQLYYIFAPGYHSHS
jgi:uncharacterized membrane protein